MINLRKNDGITLITLIITVILLIIITSVMISEAKLNIETKQLADMYNDIKLIEDNLLIYYSKSGEIPKTIKFQDEDTLDEIKKNSETGDYYEIDLTKFKNLILVNGLKQKGEQDIYIVNEKTLTVHYVKGVMAGGKIHH